MSFEIKILAPNGFKLIIKFPTSPTADNMEIEAEDSVGNKAFDDDLRRSGL